MKKKFAETKVGGFIQKVAPSVLDTIGNVFPAVELLKGLIPASALTKEQRIEFDAAIQEYELKELQEYMADVKDARAMNVSIQQSDKSSKLARNAAYYIDFLIVGATIVVGLLLFFRAIPIENSQVVNIVFGSLLTLCATVVNFHRGSTQGSAKKTDLLFTNLQK